MRRATAIAATTLALGGCGAAPPAADHAAAPRQEPPRAGAPLPRAAPALARRLSASSAGLTQAIGAWSDRAHTQPPAPVALYALDQQRILRALAGQPRLAAQVERRLRPGLRKFTHEVLAAMHDLRRLSPPPHRRRFKTGPARPPDELLGYYRAAQRRFGVGWHVLAAVNFVESAFGKLQNDSVAGAQGPMQFLPATWRAYGLGGDIHDPHDAILGAANYLHASGAPRSYARALYHYNPSPLYVDAVLRYARRISAARNAFYDLYSWQVFVRTPEGTRRLTGP